jgi:Xaa-Pro dipeptidase
MITANGCQSRRQRLLATTQPKTPLLFTDPLHLRYFANAYVDPMTISADYGAVLVIEPNGMSRLFHDHRAPKSLELSFVDERMPLPWYDGNTAGQGPRRLVLKPIIDRFGGRIHDCLCDPESIRLHTITAEMRRAKDPDEIAMIRQCCDVGNAGFEWTAKSIQPGMTEIDVYNGVFAACMNAAGQANVVYGDFAVSPGMKRKGGPPTKKILKAGDCFILDYSVIIQGYRSDYTNTYCVGGQPTHEQATLFALCQQAMTAGERQLKAGVPCQTVYDAVIGVFQKSGVDKQFPHHAGHGLGISHPEAPFFVRQSSETLVVGDVVTLEPGLYVDGVAGMRIEHNYAITATGYERLTKHKISLTG